MSLILETRRMVLRNFIRADVERYPQIRDAVSHPHESAAELAAERSRELARGYIAAADCQPRLDYQLAMLERVDGRLIGSCGVCLHGRGARSAEFNCEVAADWQRQGLALEAGEALLAVVFRDLGLENVSARIPAENLAGQGLADRLGMRAVDPTETPAVLYTIGAGEWTRGNS